MPYKDKPKKTGWEIKDWPSNKSGGKHEFYIGDYQGMGTETLVVGWGDTEESAREDAIQNLTVLHEQIREYLAANCKFTPEGMKPKESSNASSK